MRSSFPSCFSVNLIIKIVVTLAANNTNSSSVKTSDERPPFPRVRVCTVFEVTEVNKAIKNLEAKLENLTTQNLKTNSSSWKTSLHRTWKRTSSWKRSVHRTWKTSLPRTWKRTSSWKRSILRTWKRISSWKTLVHRTWKRISRLKTSVHRSTRP